jgi:hypothetical protein
VLPIFKTPCLAVAVLSLFSSPAVAAPAHPHLLFGAEDVAAFRSRAAGTHKAIYDALKTGTDAFLGTRIRANGDVVRSDGSVWYNLGDRRDIGDSLMVFSFVWQIDGGAQYLDLAQHWLSDVTSWSTLDLDATGTDPHDLIQEQILAGVGFAYDVLYPTLSDAQRAKIRGVIQRNADEVAAAIHSGIWWNAEPLQNHNWINCAALGLAALAVEGELPASKTDAWRKLATDNVHKVYDATGGIDDGTWHEGTSYLGYGYVWQLPYLAALQRAGHEDLTDFPMLRRAGQAAAHGLIPEQPAASVLTYGDFFGFAMDLASLRFAASRHGDRLAQWVANRVDAATPRNNYAPESVALIMQFLFYDPSVPEADLKGEPLDWSGGDLEAVIFRSGWEAGGTLFAMKSGTYGGRSVWERLAAHDPGVGRLNWGHDHADDNGFYLYGNGTWLAPEAEGYSAEEASFTRFHNAITIDDHGQLGEGARPNGDEDLAYPWFGSRQGSIPFQGSSSHFAYALGDGAKLYDPGLGLKRWDRHTLFLDRKWVVVRDRVEASTSHRFAWFCHFMEGASQDGTWIHGKAQNGQALGVAVVAPASWSFGAAKQTLPYIERLNKNGYVWAATVTAPAQASVSFLTALVPVAESGWSDRPKVTPLTTGAPDLGLYLTEGTRVAAAVFGADPGSDTQAGDYHLVGQAGVAEYQGGIPDRALLVEGSLLEDKDRKLLEQSAPLASMLEAEGLASDTLALSGDTLGTVTVYAPRASRVTWAGREVPFTRDGDLVKVSLSPPWTGAKSAGTDLQTTGGSSPGIGGQGCSSGSSGALALATLSGLIFARRRRRT